MVRDQRVYDASCASGFASRTSAGIQLSAAGNGAVGGFGIDATELVPPFLPSYRCSDAQFLIMLKRIHANSVVAFLPEAIEHWPLDGQTRGRGAIWESTGLRFWDIVRAIVSRERVEEAGGSPSQRLVTSGRAIREAAAASAKDFRRMLL